MLNLIQHLTNSKTYETLKQVQGDKLGLFTRASYLMPTKTKKAAYRTFTFGHSSIFYKRLSTFHYP